MKVLIQRVTHASVQVDGGTVGEIAQGIVALVGIQKHDSASTLEAMANKLLSYRMFADTAGKMNLSVKDVSGGVLAISQFTLAADTQKGLRPSFSSAAAPAMAGILYADFVAMLRARHNPIATGIFAADMQVSLINDGPVTFMLEN